MRIVLIHPNYHSGGAEIAGNWLAAFHVGCGIGAHLEARGVGRWRRLGYRRARHHAAVIRAGWRTMIWLLVAVVAVVALLTFSWPSDLPNA
mgnify:CR=1 FL=1